MLVIATKKYIIIENSIMIMELFNETKLIIVK